jgi:hypothetical protein
MPQQAVADDTTASRSRQHKQPNKTKMLLQKYNLKYVMVIADFEIGIFP